MPMVADRAETCSDWLHVQDCIHAEYKRSLRTHGLEALIFIVVERRRIELLTPCVQSRCSPS